MLKFATVYIAVLAFAACSPKKDAAPPVMQHDDQPAAVNVKKTDDVGSTLRLHEAVARAVAANADARLAVLQSFAGQNFSASPHAQNLDKLVSVSQSLHAGQARNGGKPAANDNLENAWQAGELALTYAGTRNMRSLGIAEKQIEEFIKDKAVDTIIVDAYRAFYRYLAFQNMADRIDSLDKEVSASINKISGFADGNKDATAYMQSLIRARDQINVLRQEKSWAKLDLTSLINADNDASIRLIAGDNIDDILGRSGDEMDRSALMMRPEIKILNDESLTNVSRIRQEISKTNPDMPSLPGGRMAAGAATAGLGVALSAIQTSSDGGQTKAFYMPAAMVAVTQTDIASDMLRQAQEHYSVVSVAANIARQAEEAVTTSGLTPEGTLTHEFIRARLERLFAMARMGSAAADLVQAGYTAGKAAGTQSTPRFLKSANIEGMTTQARQELPVGQKEPVSLLNSRPQDQSSLTDDESSAIVQTASMQSGAQVNSMLQLAAYNTRDAAMSGWSRLLSNNPGLGGYQPQVKEVVLPSGETFYRLMIADNPDRLKALCIQLYGTLGGNCIIR